MKFVQMKLSCIFFYEDIFLIGLFTDKYSMVYVVDQLSELFAYEMIVPLKSVFL